MQRNQEEGQTSKVYLVNVFLAFKPLGSIVLALIMRVASLALRMESRDENIFSIGISCISVAVWLGLERKCSETVVGLDVLLELSNSSTVLIKSVFQTSFGFTSDCIQCIVSYSGCIVSCRWDFYNNDVSRSGGYIIGEYTYRGIYLALSTGPEGNSWLSIYQNIAIKIHIDFVFKETIQCKPFSFFSIRVSCHAYLVLY